MLAKFSVKKPFTVLVCIIIVIILGVVSFMNMTPDLLPNMEFPYAIIMTAYPGAAPETVENELTRPIEQSMATLDNIKTVSSTSSENYSVVTLEFSEDADMDTVTIDIREKLNLLSEGFNDMVGTPNIIKINPSMLPVAVYAMNMSGMDIKEISEFTADSIENRLDGIEGVAGVTIGGVVTEKIQITLDEELIANVNDEIRASIDEKLKESEDELKEAREKLEDSKDELNEGKDGIKKGKTALEKAQKELAEQMAQKNNEISAGEKEMLQTKITVSAALAELTTAYEQMEKGKTAAEQGVAALENAKTGLEAQLALLSNVSVLEGVYSAKIAAAMSTGNFANEDEAIAYLNANDADFASAAAALSEADAALNAMGKTRADIPELIVSLTSSLADVNTQLAEAQSALSELNKNMAEASKGIAEMEAALKQIAEGEAGLDQAKIALKTAEATANMQIYQNLAQTASAEAALGMTEAQLDSAEEQLEAGEEQFNDAKEDAYKKADAASLLSKNTLSQLITAQNLSMPAGYALGQGDEQWMVSVGDAIADADELKELVLIDMDLDEPIRLKDVAKVDVVDNSDSIYAHLNGTDEGVLLSFQKQSGVATATASENIQETLDELCKEYPGLSFVPLMDQGDYIHIVINSVLENLLIGAVLAIIILLLFLKDLRPTLIVAISIPVSVTFAIVLMYFSGITLNMISLSGLAVGVGMLVDNSIVVIENIYRLRNMGYSPFKAAISGAAQVTGALISSTLTTVCVFIPIVFLEGITRQLFQDLALTVGYSLVASLIIALTLVPAMASGVLKKAKPPKKNRVLNAVNNAYKKALSFCLSKKFVPIVISVVLLIATVVLAVAKGFTFMPEMESTEVMANITVTEDMTFDEIADMADEISLEIKQIDGVDTVGAMQSSGLAGVIGLSGTDEGDLTEFTMYAVLDENVDSGGGSIEEKFAEILEKHGITEYSISGVSSMAMGSSFSSKGLSYNVYGGKNIDELASAARLVAETLKGVDGVKEAEDGIGETTPELNIAVNKVKAIENGFTVGEVYAAVAAEIGTSSLGAKIDDKEVVITSGNTETVSTDDIRELVLKKNDNFTGEEITVDLKEIAEITEGESLNSINRTSQRRYISVSAEVKEGYNVTLVGDRAEEALKNIDLPENVRIESTGQNETIMSSMSDLLILLLLGIVIVYLIMVAQFQSLLSPFIVMFTIPLAITGGLAALLISGMEISVVSMIGFVMLVGIIVNNGIVLIDYINQLRREGVDRTEAIKEACITRIRPVLMTALTTILGLVPMALALGTGAALTQPMAVTCIGGLIYATFMTLFIVPVLYDVMCKRPPRVVTKEELEIAED